MVIGKWFIKIQIGIRTIDESGSIGESRSKILYIFEF